MTKIVHIKFALTDILRMTFYTLIRFYSFLLRYIEAESCDKQFAKTYFHRWYRMFMSLFICYVIERKKAINFSSVSLLVNIAQELSKFRKTCFSSENFEVFKNWIFLYDDKN